MNLVKLTQRATDRKVKLNPLDGVYYCDIRPNMTQDPVLKKHIRTFDHLLLNDIWELIK